jgi:hypothetical protein
VANSADTWSGPDASVGVPIAVSVRIRATPEQVWAVLERVEDHVEWMRDAVAIRFEGQQRRGVGTAFLCDTKVGPFRLTDAMAITEWSEGHLMGVRHQGLVTGSGRFSLLTPVPGTTVVHWEERLCFPWFLGGLLTAFCARPVLSHLWRGNLEALRAQVEAAG